MEVITETKRVTDDQTDITFCSDFLPSDYAQQVFDYLLINTPWPNGRTGDWRTAKSRVNINYGEPGVSYDLTIRGKTTHREVIPWSADKVGLFLKQISDLLAEKTGFKSNYVVVQLYPRKSVGIPPHRDKEIVSGTAIMGLSFGAPRILTIASTGKTASYGWLPPKKPDAPPSTFQFRLNSGSLYILHPPTNDFNTHCIEPGEEDGVRISLTYRLGPNPQKRLSDI